MRNKFFLPLGITLSLALLAVAVRTYPGGSQISATSVGFDWKQNYLCNLFGETAVNGAVNTARSWAISGWAIMCISIASFFISFSGKVAAKGPARVIRYCGILGMISAFLAVTPLHDNAITGALVFSMISVVYITACLFKTKFTRLKILAIVAIVIAYAAAAVYYTRFHLEILPTLQKATLVSFLLFFLCLHYFTTREDFPPSSRVPTRR
jgi:hypothetical protein